MKTTRNLFIGIILGAVIGWALGFLRFPYIEENSSFLLGFIACLAIVALILILLFIWKKNSRLVKLLSKESTSQHSNDAKRSYAFIWIMVSAFILVGGLLSSFLIYKQSKFFESKIQEQNKAIHAQSELIAMATRSNLVMLMNDILDKVDDELQNNPDRTLSDKTIARIVAAFNYTFAPYLYWEGDSLSKKKLSPEKGQLLLALFQKNIDSSSLQKIKLNASFHGADLREGNLRGVDLSNSNLRGADFRNAHLEETDLRKSDLREVCLISANLTKAGLSGADLRRSDLRWIILNSAQMDSANFNGANLSNAQLRRSSLYKAKFWTANLDWALFDGANLEKCELVDASLKNTNLTKVNFTNASFFRANFKNAILTGAELNSANVEKDWIEKLFGWQVAEAEEIKKKYRVVTREVSRDVHKYTLEKI